MSCAIHECHLVPGGVKLGRYLMPLLGRSSSQHEGKGILPQTLDSTYGLPQYFQRSSLWLREDALSQNNVKNHPPRDLKSNIFGQSLDIQLQCSKKTLPTETHSIHIRDPKSTPKTILRICAGAFQSSVAPSGRPEPQGAQHRRHNDQNGTHHRHPDALQAKFAGRW